MESFHEQMEEYSFPYYEPTDIKLKNKIGEGGTGKVYNGAEALEKSLVDEIGHQTEAIEWLNNIADIRTNTPIIDYRISQETGLVSFILQRFGLKLNKNNNMIGLRGLLLQWQP